MEFIDDLSHQLSIDTPKAEALAGGLLGVVKTALSERAGADAVSKFVDAIPELSGWEAQSRAQMGADAPGEADSGLGGLLGSALSSLGGDLGGAMGSVAILAPMLGKLGIDESHLQMIVPLLSRFLGQRLDGDLLSQVGSLLPFLGQEGGEGGLAGILGGLLS
jgi:hypothetical protein